MAAISDFITALEGGGARPNRFEVVVGFPAFAATQQEIRKTAFLATSTQIPGSTIGAIEQAFRGRQAMLPGDRTYADWECTFLNDTDFALHDAFELWQNAINSYNSNTSSNAPREIMSEVSIYQLDNNDNRIKEKVLRLAWPSDIGPIELSQDNTNTIETFSVTFKFSDIDNGNST